MENAADHERVTNKSTLELFRARGDLQLPANVHADDLRNISFYAFWRLYDVSRGALIKKQV